jgi:phosphoribosylformylglycinamidine (FGAM) synthase-like enzyme
MTPSQVQERVAQLEKDYNSVNLARLRAGVGVSSVLVPGGAFMLALGIGVTNFEATSGGPGGTGPALIVSGALALAGGLVGIFMASPKLKRRKKKRRRIELKIADLKRALPPE